ncbi:MAG: hypothetical protein EPN97_08275 [Alphaproteobacteria bacterium]|nr:MAG: hypothetical protein EPN97_08275 [Alphaproteobacteria bacterium]
MRQQLQNVSLPALSGNADTLTRHFLTQFMHELQRQRGKDAYFRIYAAIESTAAKTGTPPEVVARALVESGLRAARESFPGKFVAAVEKRGTEPKWNIAAATEQQRELLEFWNADVTDYRRERRFH